MNRPLPELRALAQTLMENERARRAGEEPVSAAERILHSLAERISPLVEAAHPWLGAVQVERDEPHQLPGAAEAAREAAPEEVAVAVESLIAELIGLVAHFLGADMAIRLVRQCFPEVARGDRGSGSEETSDE